MAEAVGNLLPPIQRLPSASPSSDSFCIFTIFFFFIPLQAPHTTNPTRAMAAIPHPATTTHSFHLPLPLPPGETGNIAGNGTTTEKCPCVLVKQALGGTKSLY